MDPWKKHPAIFEINTWVWLNEMSRQLHFPVTLANVPDSKWDELARFHVEAVWLMGVWERSPRGIEISSHHAGNLADFRQALPDFILADNVGSPYCVRRYDVDAQLGGNEGLAVAREKLARNGIRLILDFVPNHLAHDHPWVEESSGYFIPGTSADLRNDPVTYVKIKGHILACGKDPYYPAWQDVLQVNAFHPGLREAMIETVTRIAGQCDGVRCDMAMLVMNDIFESTWGTRAGARPETDFWEVLIPAVKRSNHDFIFIAEAYWDREWALQQQGFDYCYDKRLYDRLEQGGTPGIRLHLQADIAYQSKLVRFIENHDEPRQSSAFLPGKDRAAAVIISTLPGARLYHEGQFEGRKIKLPVFLRRRQDETVDDDLKAFYLRLLDAAGHPVFQYGSWQLCDCSGWSDNNSFENLLAWSWSDDHDFFMIVINYAPVPSQGRVRPPCRGLGSGNWLLKDLLSGIAFPRNGDEIQNKGLFVSLDPWQFHFFRFYRG